MTRSVEIPDAARAASLLALHADPEWHRSDGTGVWRANYERAVNLILEAALPYLAPAGDGGLREALEKLAKERDSVNGSVPSDYFIMPYEVLQVLAAHPAAPAVPQPAGDSVRLDLLERLRSESIGNPEGLWLDAHEVRDLLEVLGNEEA